MELVFLWLLHLILIETINRYFVSLYSTREQQTNKQKEANTYTMEWVYTKTLIKMILINSGQYTQYTLNCISHHKIIIHNILHKSIILIHWCATFKTYMLKLFQKHTQKNATILSFFYGFGLRVHTDDWLHWNFVSFFYVFLFPNALKRTFFFTFHKPWLAFLRNFCVTLQEIFV